MRFLVNFLHFFVTIWGFSLNNVKTSVLSVNWFFARWRTQKYLSKSSMISTVSINICAWKTRLKHIKALRTAAPPPQLSYSGGLKALWREGTQYVQWESSIIDTWYRQMNVFCREYSNCLRCLHTLLHFCSLRYALPISIYASLSQVLFWVPMHTRRQLNYHRSHPVKFYLN